MNLYYFLGNYYILENGELQIFADSESLVETFVDYLEDLKVKNINIINLKFKGE